MSRTSCEEAIIKGIKSFCEKEDFFIKEEDMIKMTEEMEVVMTEEGI